MLYFDKLEINASSKGVGNAGATGALASRPRNVETAGRKYLRPRNNTPSLS